MTISNVPAVPRTWSDDELAADIERAVNAFVDRRLSEPSTRYVSHLRTRRKALARLFRVLAPIDPAQPDITIVRKVLADKELFAALRYVAGPPVSEDDLGVIVTRKPKRLTQRELTQDDQLVQATLRLICQLSDASRFPWIRERREATFAELRTAIRATAVLHATRSLETERRAFGKEVEGILVAKLITLGFSKRAAPNGGTISAPIHHPSYPDFYGECSVYGRRVDLFIALPDKRVIAVEAKDSSSVVNSVKRVLNDTAAKAKHFSEHMGKNCVPVVLLSGVFGLENLRSAQDKGLYIVWSHALDDFIEWIKAQQ